jgi:hypothetical protein
MKRQYLAAAIAALMVMFFLAPLTTRSQQATTSLSGSITDASGATLPGASVTGLPDLLYQFHC